MIFYTPYFKKLAHNSPYPYFTKSPQPPLITPTPYLATKPLTRTKFRFTSTNTSYPETCIKSHNRIQWALNT